MTADMPERNLPVSKFRSQTKQLLKNETLQSLVYDM